MAKQVGYEFTGCFKALFVRINTSLGGRGEVSYRLRAFVSMATCSEELLCLCPAPRHCCERCSARLQQPGGRPWG